MLSSAYSVRSRVKFCLRLVNSNFPNFKKAKFLDLTDSKVLLMIPVS
ncbi:MAG: hypothetical protein JWR26_1490 [Pedosphaera sp.]|nr:hypothetical protein [Pedosphaera sp.]